LPLLKLKETAMKPTSLFTLFAASTLATGCGLIKVQGLPGSNSGQNATLQNANGQNEPQGNSKGEFDPEAAAAERRKQEAKAVADEKTSKATEGLKRAKKYSEEAVAQYEKHVAELEKGDVDMLEAVIGFPSTLNLKKQFVIAAYEREAPGVTPPADLLARVDAAEAKHLPAVKAAAAKAKPTKRSGADANVEKEMRVECGYETPKSDYEVAVDTACKKLKGKARTLLTSGNDWKINDRGNRYKEGMIVFDVPGAGVCFEITSEAGNKIAHVGLYSTDFFSSYADKGRYVSCK
jgi:hypothetical protein